MNPGGVVVFNLYAKYFDTRTNECATKQSWIWPFPLPVIGSLTSNPLTQSLRTQLNILVDNANQVLLNAISTAQANAKTMTLVSSNWDPWVQATAGTFCQPGSSPSPGDPSNANVLFFKLATYISWVPGLFIRGDGGYGANGYGNLTTDELMDVAEHEYLKLHQRDVLTLDEREFFDYVRYMALEERVNDPACSRSFISSLIPWVLLSLLPCNANSIYPRDSIGKIFHPNELVRNFQTCIRFPYPGCDLFHPRQS